VDRRGFFKSMLGKGLDHGARQVDAVIIPFERAARAAREAMPGDDAAVALQESEPGVGETPTPLPAQPVATTIGEDDLMRVCADAGLIRHVEAAASLARRSVRLVPGDGPPPAGSRTRAGGAPDLPAGAVWPNWDAEPLTFLAQIDLAEAHAAGLDPLLPEQGLLLIFSALDRTPSGSDPLDREGTHAMWVEAERVPAAAPEPIGPCQPQVARALALSSEFTLPRVWSEPVQALGLDEDEQGAWEQARRDLAALQGVDAWEAGAPLRSLHHLLGWPEESRGDMPVAVELAARGIDVGYGAPSAHPEAGRLGGAAARWRLLLQLTVDEQLGWSFGRGRERLYVWGVEDELGAGLLSLARTIAR
jgi:Domain of unknown function (DUF1963)